MATKKSYKRALTGIFSIWRRKGYIRARSIEYIAERNNVNFTKLFNAAAEKGLDIVP